ncbi:YigZ family protein [Desulfuribacillus alkaliarsenatis]|uniref:YigZ family protein n=1 Tax=Desulfuribacillus alkaliarsenatis TaxID=766136 RepID=A0A1E5G1N3_9FIRM|nr:YigZ family protein [Desulfuribacillus alkaliarsenatis]OEF96805.1 YigZ family protein [Desulfuribacillus alkaliarsenatis]
MGKDFSILEYRTITSSAEHTNIVKKSKFIAHVKPVETENEAIAFIDEIKRKHYDATHNCSAYMIGENDQVQKASDDGEPSGTAGKPILEVIKKERLKNVVVVVTRYFGGIMLGAGGLIRAYGQAAADGIHKAGIVQRIMHTEVKATVDYTWVGKVENELHSKVYKIAGKEYTDKVTFTILAKAGEEAVLEKLLTELTNGQVEICYGSRIYVDI